MNPVITEMRTIPTINQSIEIGPKNNTKNNHIITYHAMDSDIIKNPLKNPKCSVSNPVTKSFPLVIPNGEYGDLVNNNVKNIIAASGIEAIRGP